ncbi:MAG TPA: MMPL family transporter [Gemmataceae bacterium]|nr:MMPL family transporter [Gemmataceae bacterium]
MFKFLGRFAAAHPWLICAAWLLAGAGVALLAPPWDDRAQDDDVRFLPARCASVRGYHLLEQAFPQDVYASRALFAVERRPGALTEADLALVDEAVADLQRLREEAPELGITRVCSHRDPFVGGRLLSADRQCTLVQVSLATPYMAQQTRAAVDRADECFRRRLEGAAAGLTARATGAAGLGRDLVRAGGDSLEGTTLATVALVVVILLLVHRAPLLALVPLATIAGSVWVALKLLAACTLLPGFHLVNISRIFAVVMLYGAGTDYCLFLISRYREELVRGRERGDAVARSVGAVGGALAASAGTVVCGLGLMGLAEFAKVRCGGPAIAISLTVALLASLTLAPALLQILGRAAFWPCAMPRPETGERRRQPLWDAISRGVTARPALVWAAAVLLLLPLALLGLGVRPSYKATGELSPSCPSVEGLAVIQRHFTPGEVGPITVLLESAADWESKQGQAVIGHLSRGFAKLENVAEVRSLTQPLGEPLAAPRAPPEPRVQNLRGDLFKAVWRNVAQGLADGAQRGAREFYLTKLPATADGAPARHVTRLDVVLKTDPFDPRSLPTLALVQTWLREELPRSTGPLGEVRAECYGVTVNARDLAEVTESDRLRINVLVLGAIFLILLALVRRPVLAAYLLATVLFSYFATLGATTLAAYLWHGRPLGEVDWRVPFFLFTILVAVGEDYNILLVTRALQERKRHGAEGGTRRALARTGGTITSCGLIMAGTFATLMLSGLNTLVQIGFALAFGVLLDTFVVRPFLVPPLTLWLWQREERQAAPADAPTLRLVRAPDPPRRPLQRAS